MSILGSIIGAGLQAGLGAINNEWAAERARQDRAENYRYGEMAANNADARTRSLYNDFYSPQALMRQYQQAGLSTSMMFGGTPGQGGTSGAQGTGAAGPSTPYMPISMLEGAQIANIAAQTENIKADTANKELENEVMWLEKQLKDIEVKTNDMLKDTAEGKWLVNNLRYVDDDGQLIPISIYDIADVSTDFDDFMNKIRSFKYSEGDREKLHTEAAQEELRRIYKVARTFNSEIRKVILDTDYLESQKNLTDEQKKIVEWQVKVSKAMENAGFAEMNAKTAVSFLKAQIADSELTEMQKGAWNRILNRIGDDDKRDLLIVIAMIFNKAASSWHNPF